MLSGGEVKTVEWGEGEDAGVGGGVGAKWRTLEPLSSSVNTGNSFEFQSRSEMNSELCSGRLAWPSHLL